MIPLTFDPWRGRIKPEEFKSIFRNIIAIRDEHTTVCHLFFSVINIVF